MSILVLFRWEIFPQIGKHWGERLPSVAFCLVELTKTGPATALSPSLRGGVGLANFVSPSCAFSEA